MKILLAVLLLLCGVALVRGGVGVRNGKPITINVRKITTPVKVPLPSTEHHNGANNYHSLTYGADVWIPWFLEEPAEANRARYEPCQDKEIAMNGWPFGMGARLQRSITGSEEDGWLIRWRRLPNGYEYIYTENLSVMAQVRAEQEIEDPHFHDLFDSIRRTR